MNSTHQVKVVPVVLERHPNADSLSIVSIDGYTVVVKTEDWIGKDRGAYIPPDNLVDLTRPEFSWLDRPRVKAKRIRGIPSFGLLIPSEEPINTDLTEILGVTHYEEKEVAEEKRPKGERPKHDQPAIQTPKLNYDLGKYDIESLRKYPELFIPGEPVVVTEKIHGANARYYSDGNGIFAGSRTEWKEPHLDNLWWKAWDNTPGLRSFVLSNPGWLVYGEVYGKVKGYSYGVDVPSFMAFDIVNPAGVFLDYDAAYWKGVAYQLPWVPALGLSIPYYFKHITDMAEGPSMVSRAKNIREGCVVRPIHERWSKETGRVQLKCVGVGFLEGK